eukprot:TRINITY_DN5613_c0_g1_i1.p1 TRINITY_DN5613_c0_g1~~TRINITY_DN5613_c0_g1_i1.p1  ORF type:complete len:461 (+),score=197.79 TRINITY_DN5613_c0_g1_i1:57-1385(+)
MPQKVLVLGAGLVVKPLVAYLDRHGYEVTLGSRGLEKAQKVVEGTKAKSVKIDVEQKEDLAVLEKHIKEVDLVISMLPWLLHTTAAKMAIGNGKHFLTTSYLSAAMKEMDAEAKEKGLIMINECGVDPGTDHMSASRVMDAHKAKGGKITSFTSFCGGLPAPANNNNPFGYKFSWAPRGVLLAAKNAAKYYEGGDLKDVPSEDLWSVAKKMDVKGFSKPFEGVPNRDSTQYKEIYNLPDIKTLLRGTFRYAGWADILLSLVKLDMLDLTEGEIDMTYNQMMLKQAGGEGDAKEAVSKKVGHPVDGEVIAAMTWLGLFTDEKVQAKTRLDSVCELMKMKNEMEYATGEKDMIVMKHTYEVEYPDRTEYLSTQLVDYGLDDGTTSMSRTVGLPVAIAARLVLEGKIALTGIQIPIVSEIYNPILDELAKENIIFEDNVDKVVKK